MGGAQPQKQADRADPGQISISISGDKASVARLILAMAGAMGADAPQAAPEPMLLTRDQVMERTGWGHNRVTNLVAEGRLTNHGSGRKLLISPKELADLIADMG